MPEFAPFVKHKFNVSYTLLVPKLTIVSVVLYHVIVSGVVSAQASVQSSHEVRILPVCFFVNVCA